MTVEPNDSRSSWPGGIDFDEAINRMEAHIRRRASGTAELAAKYPGWVEVPAGPSQLYRLVALADFEQPPFKPPEADLDVEVTPDAEDVLTCLYQVSEERRLQDFLEWALIAAARRRGVPFRKIAEALRLGTAQAAKQRFERLSGGRFQPALWQERLNDIDAMRTITSAKGEQQ